MTLPINLFGELIIDGIRSSPESGRNKTYFDMFDTPFMIAVQYFANKIFPYLKTNYTVDTDFEHISIDNSPVTVIRKLIDKRDIETIYLEYIIRGTFMEKPLIGTVPLNVIIKERDKIFKMTEDEYLMWRMSI